MTPTFGQLYDAFYRHHPYLVQQNPQRLAASCDQAVAQFPDHRNSLGFLAGYTCPGATRSCLSCCYTAGGQAGLPIALQLRARNTQVLFRWLTQTGALSRLTDEYLLLMDHAHGQYLRRLDRATGTERRRLGRGSIFRFNWSGDLVHPVQARAVHQAVASRPEMICWLYTRSFHLLPHLDPPLDNLTVWLSEDRDNREEARQARRAFPWTRLASLVKKKELKSGELVCPKLRSRDGRPALATVGACSRCRLCVQPPATVERILFPEKQYTNFHPPGAELRSLFWPETETEEADVLARGHRQPRRRELCRSADRAARPVSV